MGVSFSTILEKPILNGCQLLEVSPVYPVLHGCDIAVNCAIISGITYPAWLSAFQSSLGHPILHGCDLFKHLWNNFPEWLSALYKHLWDILSCMAVGLLTISGTTYLEWPSAFPASLGHPILHGCQLFNHLWGIHCFSN